MKIALTGATGFVGTRLVARLLAAGHQLHALGRSRPSDTRVSHFWWDAMKEEPLDASLEGMDAVINLAGEPVAQRWNSDIKRRIRESRALGTRNLVSAISKLRRPPMILVSASASGYYGDRGEEMLTESSPPGSGFLCDVCVEWEQEALKGRDLGLRVALIRIGIVLGRNGGALEQMLPPFRLGVGGKLGTGKQWMSWIHIDDLVGLFDHAVQHSNASGPLNGVAPGPVRNEDFTKALAAAVHRPAVLPAPMFGLRLLFGEMASIVTASQRILPEATRQSGFDFRFTDLRDALKDAVG